MPTKSPDIETISHNFKDYPDYHDDELHVRNAITVDWKQL